MHTIYDVAAAAEVSIATVSRVFQGSDQVREDLRRRVLEAAGELGYQPNALARTLASGQSHSFGVVIPPSLANPYFATLLEHLCASSWRHGYEAMVAVPRGPQTGDLLKALAALERRMVDGVLVWADEEFAEAYLAARGATDAVPVVMLGCLPTVDLPLVAPDEESGGYEATRHLIDLGHTRIAFLCMNEPEPRRHGRESGYFRALAETGLEPLSVQAYGNMENGRHAMASLLDESPDVTAVVAHSDEVAFGALKALAERGLQAPRDVSIVGFDNLPLASYSSPSLTTVEYPIEDMALIAVDLLAAAARAERGEAPSARVLVRPRLVRRESTCAPPTASPPNQSPHGPHTGPA